MSNIMRRQTISDNLINDKIFEKLLNFTLANVKDQNNMSQIEIVNLLLPKKISNVTIARVINILLPNASATKGSVASLVNRIRGKNDLITELLQDLEDVQ